MDANNSGQKNLSVEQTPIRQRLKRFSTILQVNFVLTHIFFRNVQKIVFSSIYRPPLII